MKFLRIEAVARMDRAAALPAASDAISQAGGWIVDHRLYSDLRAVINFALPADQTGALGCALAAAGLRPDPEPPATLGQAGQEVFGQLQLTFLAGRGDLKRPVPAFS